MKITTTAEEIRSFGPCEDGYKTYLRAHGQKETTLSKCLKSNGWSDFWWLIDKIYNQLSDNQKRDLRLLAADYAEHVLPMFEKSYPNDDRPRKAIQAARDYANELINDQARAAARAAARGAAARGAAARGAAARAAAWAAEGAAGAAAWAAEGAAGAAARGAAARAAAWAAEGAAEQDWQIKQLQNILKKWEQK